MVFIPRHPVVENQFCSYAGTTVTSGVGNIIAYAGSVVYIDSYGGSSWGGSTSRFSRDRALVKYFSTTIPASLSAVPYGFLMQNVRVTYHQVHPAGYVLQKDMGTSDAFAEPIVNASTGAITGTKPVPVAVAQGGIWETTWYDKTVSGGYTAGSYLYVGEMGRVTKYANALPLTVWIEDSVSDNMVKPVAIVEKGLTSAEVAAGTKALRIKLLI